MKNTYIFSGFSVQEHFGEKTSEFFKKDLKNSHKIVFIPGGIGKNNKTDRYVDTDIKWFEEIGINFNTVTILDITMSSNEMKEVINKADVIFMMGGNTFEQYKFLTKYNLLENIKEFKGTVIGVSSGAINLAKTSICSKDISDGVYETKIYKGIGRINFSFEPHFNLDDEKLLIEELYPISDKLKIYGLPNDAGVKIVDGVFQIIKGNIYVIKNKKIELLSSE